MIEIDYNLSSRWQRDRVLDLAIVSETVLRYECFCGDVRFVVDETDLSAEWGRVPVLDFALGLRAVAGALVEEREQVFEFTESDATSRFVRENENMCIKANYAPLPARISLLELSITSEQFLARVIRELNERHPRLQQNQFVTAVTRTLLPV